MAREKPAPEVESSVRARSSARTTNSDGDALASAKAQFERAGIVVWSSNYTLYGDMSARVMTVLSAFTPDLEIYSIDEAFLGMGGLNERLETRARALRAAVLHRAADLP